MRDLQGLHPVPHAEILTKHNDDQCFFFIGIRSLIIPAIGSVIVSKTLAINKAKPVAASPNSSVTP